MPAFKTREELVAEALTELFADGGTGQSPDAEDRDVVDRKVDGLIEELAARNIVTVNDAQIPPEWFGPLAELLADACGPRFGRPKSAALREDAEAAEGDDARHPAPPARHRCVLRAGLPRGIARWSPSCSPSRHRPDRRRRGAGRLINSYCVKTEQGAPTPLKWLRVAGLRELVTERENLGFARVHRNQRLDRARVMNARCSL